MSQMRDACMLADAVISGVEPLQNLDGRQVAEVNWCHGFFRGIASVYCVNFDELEAIRSFNTLAANPLIDGEAFETLAREIVLTRWPCPKRPDI